MTKDLRICRQRAEPQRLLLYWTSAKRNSDCCIFYHKVVEISVALSLEDVKTAAETPRTSPDNQDIHGNIMTINMAAKLTPVGWVAPYF